MLSFGTPTTSALDTFSFTSAGVPLILGVNIRGTTTSASATFNGTSMTQVGEVAAGSNYAALFYLMAPASGAHNIVITPNGTASYRVFAIEVSGIDSVTPVGASSFTNPGAVLSRSLTTTYADGVVFNVAGLDFGNIATTVTTDASQVEVVNGVTTANRMGLGSYKTFAAQGSVTMQYTATQSITDSVWALVEFKTAPASGGTLTMMGV